MDRESAELFGLLAAEVAFTKIAQAQELSRLAWGKLTSKFFKKLFETGRFTPEIKEIGKELLHRPATYIGGIGAYKLLKGEPLL